jgi:hypothetical protein
VFDAYVFGVRCGGAVKEDILEVEEEDKEEEEEEGGEEAKHKERVHSSPRPAVCTRRRTRPRRAATPG